MARSQLAPGGTTVKARIPLARALDEVAVLLIADDHEVVRRGVRTLLEARPEWNNRSRRSTSSAKSVSVSRHSASTRCAAFSRVGGGVTATAPPRRQSDPLLDGLICHLSLWRSRSICGDASGRTKHRSAPDRSDEAVDAFTNRAVIVHDADQGMVFFMELPLIRCWPVTIPAQRFQALEVHV
jgi:hypothetical protein